MTEDPVGYGLDFAPLVDHVRHSFPAAIELRVERGEDGLERAPTGVQWLSMLPLSVLEAMGIKLTILGTAGQVLTPEAYAALVVAEVERQQAAQTVQ